MGRGDPAMTGHYTCGNGHTGSWDETAAAGGAFNGCGCVEAGCGGTLNADQVERVDYKCNKCGWSFSFSDATGTSHVGEACYAGVCDGQLHRPGGDAGLFTENYACDKCAATVKMNETASTGGSHVGESHAGCAQTGKLARKTPNVVTAIPKGNRIELAHAAKSGYKGIPVPSLGNPLGVSWNFEADTPLWAHELAHNRYMEHAANAGGANNAQHDHQNNSSPSGRRSSLASSGSTSRARSKRSTSPIRWSGPNRARRLSCRTGTSRSFATSAARPTRAHGFAFS